MEAERAAKRLFDGCVRMGRYQPHELMRWLVSDVLAGFGVRTGIETPADLRTWLFDQGAEYARAVHMAPFEDVLGALYQMLGSRGHRGMLGQFFTPQPVAELMAHMVGVVPVDASAADQGGGPARLLRMCEPACGSGALVLAFLRHLIEREGRSGPRRWSITAIDLDTLCAQICATQILSNILLGQFDLGELVVYSGNALAPPDRLKVVVHASARDQRPDLILPAIHPSRVVALRLASQASIGQAAAQDAPPLPTGENERGAKRTPSGGRPTHEEDMHGGQIDLFGS